jgi:hypothetical protein
MTLNCVIACCGSTSGVKTARVHLCLYADNTIPRAACS